MKFTPESATITRRADGAWDMVALCGTGELVTRIEFILDDASINLVTQYTLTEDIIHSAWVMETIPAKAARTDLSLTTKLRGGVGGNEKTNMRVTHIEGSCGAAE